MSEYEIDFGLGGRVAAVTGAAQGIGQACAAAMAHAGADVALVDLDEARLDETAGLVEAAGRRALRVAVDVSDRAAVHAAFDRIVAELGRVDALVNCAAVISPNVPAQEASEQDMDLLWDVNVKGTFFCAQAASRDMLARGSGRIVNLASQAALLSLPNQSVYTATKGAVRPSRGAWRSTGPRAASPSTRSPRRSSGPPMAAPMLEIQQVHDASRQADPARPHRPPAGHRGRGAVPLLGRRLAHHGPHPARGRRLDRGRAGTGPVAARVVAPRPPLPGPSRLARRGLARACPAGPRSMRSSDGPPAPNRGYATDLPGVRRPAYHRRMRRYTKRSGLVPPRGQHSGGAYGSHERQDDVH
jgi:NADP-dependent 3-hydroxy acid dehydrogenase YdfG